MSNSHRNITITSFLAVIILISGSFKIPSPLPGGEFQLSAPIAVLICALFGFKKYITAGIVASCLGLLLGTANIFNIMIAFIFRIMVGLVLLTGRNSYPSLAVSGPLGTITARIALAWITGISWQLLVIAALPGIFFTAVISVAAYKPAQHLKSLILKHQ